MVSSMKLPWIDTIGDMKKAAFVVSSIGGGGAEKSAVQIVEQLRRIGLNVDLIAINRRETPTDDVAFAIELDRKRSTGLVSTLFSIWKFRRLLSEKKYKCLILNCDLPELFGLIAPKDLSIILVEHANPPWSNRELVGRLIRFVLSRRNIRFVVVSKHLRIWSRREIEPICIPNPLGELASSWTFESGSELKRLVYVGRLSRLFKRPEIVLKIAKRLELPCIFIGQGDQLMDLQSQADSLNITIEFRGFVKDPWSEVRAGDLLIIPSSAEGDGLVLVEAVQRKIPFLATDIPDLNKYGIASANYCKDENDFVFRVKKFSHQLDSLVVPSEIREEVVKSRELSKICSKWAETINLI